MKDKSLNMELVYKILNLESPDPYLSVLMDLKQKNLLDYSDRKIDTLLITAVMTGQKKWVSNLLFEGANLNAKNIDDETVFDVLKRHESSEFQDKMLGFIKVVQLVKAILNNESPQNYIKIIKELKQKNLLDYSDQEIDSPLITAVMMKQKEWTSVLLGNGADVSAKDIKGRNVFAVLNSDGSEEIKGQMKDFLSNQVAKREMFAFIMAHHPRLGDKSEAKILPTDVMGMIASQLQKSSNDREIT